MPDELDAFWQEYLAAIRDPRWAEVAARRIRAMLMAKDAELDKRLLEQVGRINFNGETAARFWVRTFGLDNEVREALAMFALPNMPPEHDRISTPVIGDYKVNPELTFYYVILLTVDRLNIIDGIGTVYYTGPAKRKEVEEVWRKMGDDIMEELQKSGKPGKLVLFEPTKEAGRVD